MFYKKTGLQNLKAIPYTAIIDLTIPKLLFYMWKFDEIAEGSSTISYLTESDVQSYLKSLVHRSTNYVIYHVVIEKFVADFSIPKKISECDDLIKTYCAEFFERIETIGCEDFFENPPKNTARLLM